MPKVIIHYFSATGNTAHAVKLIEENLTASGYEVVLQPVKSGSRAKPEQSDFAIFAFPILSWAAPAFFQKYIKRLPEGNGMKTAVFATFGGHPGMAFSSVGKLLRKKHYDVFLTAGAGYPINWTQMMSPPQDEIARSEITMGDKQTIDFIRLFKNGKNSFFSAPASLIWTKMVGYLFALIGRRFLGKIYIADENCNRCGICIKACPARTIRFRGIIKNKPQWKFNCENCNRCINICPQKAIQVSIPRMAIHGALSILLTVGTFIAWGRLIPVFHRQLASPLAFGLDVISLFITGAVLFWLEFFPFDRLLFFLEQLPGIGGVFSASYTKKFGRYTAPGFKPLKDL